MSAPLREARITAAAISANTELLRQRASTAHTMAVVKADGYGHGAVTAARAAIEGGADQLGVADLDEAFELRAAGIDAPVLAWLHGALNNTAAIAEGGITVGVSSVAHLDQIAHGGHRLGVQVKVDTGLSRNGVAEVDWGPFVERLASLVSQGAVRLEGVFSHLSNTSPEEDHAQITAFERFLDAVRSVGLQPGIRHLAASAAALDHPAARYDMVRLGIALYGIAPEPHLRDTMALRPAMRLSAEVVGVKRVLAGSGVSYGFLHRTPTATTLALIPLGYADGVPRAATGAPVRIGDLTVTQVGRVAMDQFVVDVGDAPIMPGDRAVLWGDPSHGDPSVDAWAEASGTIAYELVTRLGRRVRRTHA